ncbi:MAG: DUF2270 domain-containing protein [Anaerolineales bacterium]|nr:DUF2270 domain-containing protein [Anaerolineales bacterium]
MQTEQTPPKHDFSPNPETPGEPQAPSPEAVWTFRGYRLRASEFNTAMVHFFRAEVSRSNFWRQRLDTTTNWAVVTTGAVLSIAFAQTHINHSVILLELLLVTFFLYIEARRYRYYELWSSRVRLMETDFFAAMLVPPFHPAADWAESLADSLLHPHFPISYWEAVGRRLRRNYLWIYAVNVSAWLAHLWLLPGAALNWGEFFQRANVGGIPGFMVLLIVLAFASVMLLLSLLTVGLQEAAGEVLPRFGAFPEAPKTTEATGIRETLMRAWFRPSHRRQQFLTFVITGQASKIADRILKEMRRGVTELPGIGMYTGEARRVLMCALTTTEVPHLKSLVALEDPKAFVIVTPAQQIFGSGFIPLQPED